MSFDINDLDSDPAQRDAELARLRREDPVHWDAKNGFVANRIIASVEHVARVRALPEAAKLTAVP